MGTPICAPGNHSLQPSSSPAASLFTRPPQRLAIGRALLRNAPILLLDEATSALDTVSERLVQETLALLQRGRTTICVAHRMSTIVNADRIAVITDGRVVALGTHAELLATSPEYVALVGELQAGERAAIGELEMVAWARQQGCRGACQATSG